MPQLLLDDRPVSEVEVARTLAQRTRGLLGREGIETGLVLSPGGSVHTLGGRAAGCGLAEP